MLRLENRPAFRVLTSLLLGSGAGLCMSVSLAAPVVNGYVMDVQMVPAVCAYDPLKNKKRKCLEGYSLNITGLYPETNSKDCTTNSSPKLPPLQAKVVARIMPDENARVALWHNIGGCVPMNASQYFRTVINHADKLKVPEELTSQETRVMQVGVLRNKMVRMNSGLAGQSIEFNCMQTHGSSMLTEIQICYKNNGQYKHCPTTVVGNCPASFTIKGSF